MDHHEDASPSSSNNPDNSSTSGTAKQAACLNCRKSKTRCLRDAHESICKRCSQSQSECVIPDYRVGRKKGIKNKRDGLDKAVHRIEQALKKSRTQSNNQTEEDQKTFHLRNLLNEAQGILPRQSATADQAPLPLQYNPQVPQPQPQQQQLPILNHQALRVESQAREKEFIDDAENPLQLLARASDLSIKPQQAYAAPSLMSPATVAPGPDFGRDGDLQTFFGPFRPRLDIGEDIDPIDMGLITMEETEMLFTYFYQNLSHTRWGLDPELHTPNFVRNRSAFLFTSILSASALFIPSLAALSKRLSVHCKHLTRVVISNRNRSPEIVLAFMVNIPWMSPGKHWSDDETCSHMAIALTIANDIYLNKLIVPSPTDGRGVPHGVGQSECITARKALDLDGFPEIDPSSLLGRRLLRRRERIWLALFVLDRGVCLARGRSFTVPLTPIIETCDEWHKSDLSDIWDGSVISSAVLRRDLVKLISDVKQTCDSNREVAAAGLQDMIEGFFNNWYATWAFAIGGNNGNSIPPYVEILVSHGRLSVYSSVINHPTAPIEVKRFFRAAGLSSALNVMRAAVQGEGRLKSMPNNTVIMISFAAMISFRLSTMDAASNRSLAPSIRILIEETADVLERIGSSPPHRKGTSALYGRHLREVLSTSNLQAPPPSFQVEMQNPYQTQDSMQMMQFSAMSDDQIIQAIHDAGGDELGNYVPNFQVDEKSGLDWLNWFNMDVNTT